MTAIVAIQYDGGAAIGLDAWTGWGFTGVRNASKYIHRWRPTKPDDSDLLIAIAGHAALNSILEEWEPPSIVDPTSVAKSLRETIMDSHWFDLVKDSKDSGIEGEFICALGDQVWSIGGTFSLVSPQSPIDYLAGGAGEGFVLGSLWSTQGLFLDQEDGWLSRLNLALGAAAEHCCEVRAPFQIKTTTGEEY